ncbi:hypothetical protein BG004_007201 [Podila humilis]|nr:hypothetical protein BG004_007201 [Podila humilis]
MLPTHPAAKVGLALLIGSAVIFLVWSSSGTKPTSSAPKGEKKKKKTIAPTTTTTAENEPSETAAPVADAVVEADPETLTGPVETVETDIEPVQAQEEKPTEKEDAEKVDVHEVTVSSGVHMDVEVNVEMGTKQEVEEDTKEGIEDEVTVAVVERSLPATIIETMTLEEIDNDPNPANPSGYEADEKNAVNDAQTSVEIEQLEKVQTAVAEIDSTTDIDSTSHNHHEIEYKDLNGDYDDIAYTPTTLVEEDLPLVEEELPLVEEDLPQVKSHSVNWNNQRETLAEISMAAQHSELNADAAAFTPTWATAPRYVPAPIQRPRTATRPEEPVKLKSRCRFWPKCTNKSCKFVHPTIYCRDPSNCTFGDRCVFIHPSDVTRMQQSQEAAKKNLQRRNTTRVRRPQSMDSSESMVSVSPALSPMH